MGFTQVFRYVPGKADWAAGRLPTAGKQSASPRAGVLARRDVPTCQLTDRLGKVRERERAVGWEAGIVVNDEGVVLGKLDQKALAADSEAVAEAVMESGPTTIRPSVPLDALAKHMRERKLDTMVVTTSDGRLVGVLYRKDIERGEGMRLTKTP
ncbi:MAG: CBS domain-containing protein [Candidatus Binatia bacterium]